MYPQAFLEREHEFTLVAVQTWTLENVPNPTLAVCHPKPSNTHCNVYQDLLYPHLRSIAITMRVCDLQKLL